jgi:hypothetical protein
LGFQLWQVADLRAWNQKDDQSQERNYADNNGGDSCRRLVAPAGLSVGVYLLFYLLKREFTRRLLSGLFFYFRERIFPGNLLGFTERPEDRDIQSLSIFFNLSVPANQGQFHPCCLTAAVDQFEVELVGERLTAQRPDQDGAVGSAPIQFVGD